MQKETLKKKKRLWAPSAAGTGSITGRGNKIPVLKDAAEGKKKDAWMRNSTTSSMYWILRIQSYLI